jgi:hypothetical protein
LGKCIIDGSQTILGASKTKAQYLKVMSIPKEETEGWTFSELIVFGNELNPGEIIKKSPADVHDFEKYLHIEWEGRIDKNLEPSEKNVNKIINTKQNLSISKDTHSLHGTAAKNAIDRVVIEITKNQGVGGSTWKDYETDAYSDELVLRVAELEKFGNVMVIHGITTWFSQAGLGRIAKVLSERTKINQEIKSKNGKNIGDLKKIDKIIVLLWYKNKIDRIDWKQQYRLDGSVKSMNLYECEYLINTVFNGAKDTTKIEVELDYMPYQ